MRSELLPFFIGCAVRATVLLGFAWGLAVLMRRASASTRHFLWACAIAAAALMPVMMMALPQWRLSSPAAFARLGSVVESPAPHAVAIKPPPAGATEKSKSQPTLLNQPGAPSIPTMVPRPQRPTPHAVNYSSIAISVWTAGTTAVLLYMFVGFLIALRRCRLATRFDGVWVDEAQVVARALNIGCPITIVESERSITPMVCGFWHPTIVMPRGAGLWPRERLRIVVLHELAHVKRRDYLTHVVAQFVCAFYWFNPVAWVAARCLSTERDRACDDFVLAKGTKGSDYARHLLEIARAMQLGWIPGPALARRSQLDERLVAILDPKIQRSSTFYARLVLLGTLLFITIPITAIQLSSSRNVTSPASPLNAAPQVDISNERDPYRSGAHPVHGLGKQAVSLAEDFHWSGTLHQGETLEVRGGYGSIRTITSTDGKIQVDAGIHDPALARVHVARRENAITFCSVVSAPNGEESECQPRRRTTGTQKSDGRVDFVVQVPAGVRFAASMIHGDITVNSLRSNVNVATIDGNITLDLSPGDGAEFYGNSVSGAIDSDFPVHENTPPLPSGHPGVTHLPRIVRATIANGGPAFVASTINGNIRLRPAVK
jgi:beta-lactamase regulating signal transducer with metallopeptidase domain